jgi:hypothetical protein
MRLRPQIIRSLSTQREHATRHGTHSGTDRQECVSARQATRCPRAQRTTHRWTPSSRGQGRYQGEPNGTEWRSVASDERHAGGEMANSTLSASSERSRCFAHAREPCRARDLRRAVETSNTQFTYLRQRYDVVLQRLAASPPVHAHAATHRSVALLLPQRLPPLVPAASRCITATLPRATRRGCASPATPRWHSARNVASIQHMVERPTGKAA